MIGPISRIQQHRRRRPVYLAVGSAVAAGAGDPDGSGLTIMATDRVWHRLRVLGRAE